MARQNKDRQDKLQPKRMKRACDKLQQLGLSYIVSTDETGLVVRYKGELVYYWPYSGWHQGKGIQPGRGFDNFFNQLK